jgi:quercetin dioxygenase-like cupin family protein
LTCEKDFIEGVKISSHLHPTMEEVFIVIDGMCEFNIQGDSILATKQSVIRIPANAEHSLKAVTDCSLFYFGISI